MTFRDRKREEIIPLGVKVRYTGDSPEEKAEALERALSKFKKIVAKEGLIEELREREYYKSAGRKRYEKRRKLLYRNKLNKEKSERLNDKKRHGKRNKSNRRRDG